MRGPATHTAIRCLASNTHIEKLWEVWYKENRASLLFGGEEWIMGRHCRDSLITAALLVAKGKGREKA